MTSTDDIISADRPGLKSGVDFRDNKYIYLICPKNRKFFQFSHDFCQKFELSLFFFLLKIGPDMMFGDILDRKEGFLENKNMYFICSKNRKFSKGANP